ncbi:hypothetical protein [Methylobacterium soli]|uniref:Uncharacterized protein n=1 Tax=Methylobacterium soli TaxID=553447 RepID=A0A6L3ST99_9HYPH|nr:hypothetical protein [Methylobacterium soli]KAB1074581.1 hypothetical protein F6X53_25685 [Methylobacterium soli]GJE46584.1 hypothetical protein AEGHOMDF_5790 [Methylobacterium soli]
MATPITINVRNNSDTAQSFFFFQAPAIYTGGSEVYTNSLFSQTVLPYSTSGAVLTFSLVLQFVAGVQQQVAPPVVGKPSGQLAASQAIGLTPAAGGAETNNTTSMTVQPSLGLSTPVSTQGPQAGSFRIVTPPFNPTLQKYNAGSAIQNVSGGITLSNFVTALPNSNLDCQPVLKFYVATGNYTAGTVMNFTSSSRSAALCDATPGYQSFNVSYNPDGTWDVQSAASFLALGANAAQGATNTVANAEILSEAGTRIVAQGQAANFHAPVTIANLVPPNAVDRLKEYQVGPIGGPYQGRLCTYVDYLTDSATFD